MNAARPSSSTSFGPLLHADDEWCMSRARHVPSCNAILDNSIMHRRWNLWSAKLEIKEVLMKDDLSWHVDEFPSGIPSSGTRQVKEFGMEYGCNRVKAVGWTFGYQMRSHCESSSLLVLLRYLISKSRVTK